jgi:hypothetical protein
VEIEGLFIYQNEVLVDYARVNFKLFYRRYYFCLQKKLLLWSCACMQKCTKHPLSSFTSYPSCRGWALPAGVEVGRAWFFWARVRLGLKLSGSGFFRILKFKIGLEAFKSWALITGLKIWKNYKILLDKSTKIIFRPFGPERLDFWARRALHNFQARRAWAWGLI